MEKIYSEFCREIDEINAKERQEKIAMIPKHTDSYYPVMCDRGLFIVNGFEINNGLGDGDFPIIERTCESKSEYYTRKQIYEIRMPIVFRPAAGEIVKIQRYDCDPEDCWTFSDVEEVQIFTGSTPKIYVIKIKDCDK
jgi:hypothetical protein